MPSLRHHSSRAVREFIGAAGMYLKRDPSYLIFYVTASCNARCSMCFNWKYNNPRSGERELTLEEIRAMAINLGRLSYVTLGGGEPFLRTDIDRICNIFYDANHARIFSIPTNGLLPASIEARVAAMLQNCPDAVFRVSMSIDGISSQHDAIRGVPGCFDKVNETYSRLARLRTAYPRLEILANTTFSTDNQGSISEIHDYIRQHYELDAYNITLIRGQVQHPDKKAVDLRKYANAVRLLEEHYFATRRRGRHPLQNLLSALPVFTRREVLKTAVAPRRTYVCHAANKMIVVDSFGNVFPCEIIRDKLGALREENYDVRAILRKPEAADLRRRIERKDCNCTWECAIQNSLVFNIKKVPALLYEAFLKSRRETHGRNP